MFRHGARACFIFIACLFFNTASQAGTIDRGNLCEVLKQACKDKFQARVVCKAVDDTIWIYMPYTPGRGGFSGSKVEDNNLHLEYKISSINPYKVIDPPELRFVVQKVLGEIRQAILQCRNPYKFFVLVVTDIQTPLNNVDQWYIGYFEDLNKYAVGVDFSGEGYSRLTWHQEKIGTVKDKDGNDISVSYQDMEGKHVNFHALTLREFVEKQINWRVYKTFTIDYNKVPFDLTPKEKQEAVLYIVKSVLVAYNFNEFENIYVRDMSMLEEESSYAGFTRKELEKYPAVGIMRKPSF